ncbi:hairy-related 5 [Pseudochaenichthys georgianus]|uniref:hairy-related 5 n=1 Tax=Pseudochaenichthys georgianus TaxID=52239 RepID=UPI00146AF2E2|nr:hairy-related 5 [Pseudochaenichthys georgianus]
MKALTSPESPRQRSNRRISKPVMEKRRRERINSSLETLRILMLENFNDDRLKNPKVEKAEILESVVNFLQSEVEMDKGHRAMNRVLTREQRPTSGRQHNYRDGMRSCLLRVSHFISSKSQELDQTDEGAGLAPQPKRHPASPGHILKTQASRSPHPVHHHSQHAHPSFGTERTSMHCDTRELFSSAADCAHIPDPVWRPWPQ